jgi:[FeFe] hydrogenase H-cluster maturation GTPase HydF
MQQTPLSMRTHVAIFGQTNAGKSALFNALLGQNLAIVSNESGTTTDPIIKAMELIGAGPIALIDTAGLGDASSLGTSRMEKTKSILDRTDFALYAADAADFDPAAYRQMTQAFEGKRIPHLLVFTKTDVASAPDGYPDAVCVSIKDSESIEALKRVLTDRLSRIAQKEESMIGGLVEAGGTVVMVVPVDSEAPKGRLILPQVQLLRDCLDHGIKCLVTRETELEDALRELAHIDLVVTDSQIFSVVDGIVPDSIPLTSFSMLMARMKGDLSVFLQGIEAISKLQDGDRVLVAEACTHNTSHEDIGRVKIPRALQKKTGKSLVFTHDTGHDFPENLSEYRLVLHCGGCMLNQRAMQSRIDACQSAGVPITNYGVVLAYTAGILDRAKKIFE